MNVMQIVTVSLRDSAADKLTVRAHQRTKEWLKHWTPRANFKAVISPSREESLRTLKDDLKASLIPDWLATESGVDVSMFSFEVSEQEAEDGRFWMPSSFVWCKDHLID